MVNESTVVIRNEVESIVNEDVNKIKVLNVSSYNCYLYEQ